MAGKLLGGSADVTPAASFHPLFLLCEPLAAWSVLSVAFLGDADLATSSSAGSLACGHRDLGT